MTRPNLTIQKNYQAAQERYAALGVDVGGFENAGGALGNGLAVTGNYLGKARTLGGGATRRRLA